MKCPNQLNLVLFKVGKQHTDMAVMSVNVMEMHNIWLNPIQFPDDPSRSGAGLKSIPTADAGYRSLRHNIVGSCARYSKRVAIGRTAKNIILR